MALFDNKAATYDERVIGNTKEACLSGKESRICCDQMDKTLSNRGACRPAPEERCLQVSFFSASFLLHLLVDFPLGALPLTSSFPSKDSKARSSWLTRRCRRPSERSKCSPALA